MPDRLHSPINKKRYRRRDRLWAHWYAFCATLGGTGLGLLIILTTGARHLSPAFPPDTPPMDPWEYPGWERWLFPAPSLMALPGWQSYVLGGLLVVGGVLWTVATMLEFRYVEDFWKVLRAGLLMLFLGWFAYAVCAAIMKPEWVVPWWLGLTHAFAYLGGFYISMLHQWRLKGFPTWVVILADTLSPAHLLICRVLARPFDAAERWVVKHPPSGTKDKHTRACGEDQPGD